VRAPRFDGDAAIWFAVAYMAAAFGLLPVMVTALAATGSPLGTWGYIAANAGVLIAAYGVTTALLVRGNSSRRLADLVFTFWLLGIGFSVAAAMLQFIGAPGSPTTVIGTIVAPFTFGAVQITGFAPLRLAEPDLGALVGVLVGFGAGRAYLRIRGRKSGSAADTAVTPMRLPSPTSRDTINTHT
jgi:hypothetical protein